MNRSKTLEVMARAITRFAYRDAYEAAEQALTAYESHLQAEGMAVVPVALVERVIRVWEWNHDEYGDACREYDSAAVAIRDYLAASPYGKAGKEKDDE
jgi:hypothetical protein